MTTVTFWAPGIPRQKGNHIAFCPRSRDFHRAHSSPCRPIITEDPERGKRCREWEQAIRVASREVAPPWPFTGRCSLYVDLFVPRPKKYAKTPLPSRSPADLDKMIRAIGDALQTKTKEPGYIVVDDSQFTKISAEVHWADCEGHERGAGAMISVESHEPQQQELIR
jgi:Holliday junction resolvase RusA-like endonuclease